MFFFSNFYKLKIISRRTDPARLKILFALHKRNTPFLLLILGL